MKDFSSYNFVGQDSDETIELMLRRHKVAIGTKFGLFFMGCLAPIVAYALMITYTTLLDDTSGFIYLLIILLASSFYLYMILFLYHSWVDYYLDIWTVTNKRIIAVEQRGLFHRTTSELRMDRIQDVSSVIKGVLSTFFKFGTIHVQTASEQDKFNFTDVPNAEEVARKIMNLHEKYVDANPPAIKRPTPDTATTAT